MAVFYCFLTAEYILPLLRGLDVGCACATCVRARQMYVLLLPLLRALMMSLCVCVRNTRGLLLTRRLGYIP